MPKPVPAPHRVPAPPAPPAPPVPRLLGALAWASLVANIGIVLTGGVVRLTGSGLGCPTWPRCTEESFVPQGELGIHGAIEFGNRLLTFVLVAVAVATFLVALRHGRPAITRIAVVLGLGVPAQAVIGGITVLTDLNPWTVAFHLLVSMAMIGVAVLLLRRLHDADGPRQRVVPSGYVALVGAIFATTWGVLYLGTVVTGSGPHAGDANAPRNGLDPQTWSQLHADLVFLLVGLTLAAVLLLRAVDAPARVRRPAWALLGVEIAQGAVGFVQYYTGLPEVLVALHLVGAALTSATATWLLVAVHAPAPKAVAQKPSSGSSATVTNSRDR
ncbi:MAG: COX15/CtaA family protein [Nocardioides sp.]|nr:COX15/CtaA family protein [Nocardioides sp.]